MVHTLHLVKVWEFVLVIKHNNVIHIMLKPTYHWVIKAYFLRLKSLPHTCTYPHLLHKQDWSLWHISLSFFPFKHGHPHSRVIHTPPLLNWPMWLIFSHSSMVTHIARQFIIWYIAFMKVTNYQVTKCYLIPFTSPRCRLVS